MKAYTKRLDGRKPTQIRETEAKVGIISRADGSAMFRTGNTIALAAVYGPRALHPSHLRNPEKGILRCNYNMLAFSTSSDRVRPGPSRRSKEIALVTQKSLLPVLDLSEYPNTVIDVFVELIQTDAGTRCAGINAAALALADAGLPMKDLVSSISIGKVGDKLVVDLTKEEEDFEGGTTTDIPVSFITRTGKITLLQLDGNVKKEELKKALELARESCEEIHKIQVKALKEKYGA